MALYRTEAKAPPITAERYAKIASALQNDLLGAPSEADVSSAHSLLADVESEFWRYKEGPSLTEANESLANIISQAEKLLALVSLPKAERTGSTHIQLKDHLLLALDDFATGEPPTRAVQKALRRLIGAKGRGERYLKRLPTVGQKQRPQSSARRRGLAYRSAPRTFSNLFHRSNFLDPDFNRSRSRVSTWKTAPPAMQPASEGALMDQFRKRVLPRMRESETEKAASSGLPRILAMQTAKRTLSGRKTQQV